VATTAAASKPVANHLKRRGEVMAGAFLVSSMDWVFTGAAGLGVDDSLARIGPRPRPTRIGGRRGSGPSDG
jgi:hypothetical protein